VKRLVPLVVSFFAAFGVTEFYKWMVNPRLPFST